ncbi:MAG: iron-sulfur cluster assembly scaffold protein [Verrucomicrobiota bacterium]
MPEQEHSREEVDKIYRSKLLELFRSPLGCEVPPESASKGWARNRTCGDEVTFFSEVSNGVILGTWQRTEGCAIATATASLLVKELAGKNIHSAKSLMQKIRHTVYNGAPPDEEAEWKVLAAVHSLPARHECVGVALDAAEKSLEITKGEK